MPCPVIMRTEDKPRNRCEKRGLTPISAGAAVTKEGYKYPLWLRPQSYSACILAVNQYVQHKESYGIWNYSSLGQKKGILLARLHAAVCNSWSSLDGLEANEQVGEKKTLVGLSFKRIIQREFSRKCFCLIVINSSTVPIAHYKPNSANIIAVGFHPCNSSFYW